MRVQAPDGAARTRLEPAPQARRPSVQRDAGVWVETPGRDVGQDGLQHAPEIRAVLQPLRDEDGDGALRNAGSEMAILLVQFGCEPAGGLRPICVCICICPECKAQ